MGRKIRPRTGPRLESGKELRTEPIKVGFRALLGFWRNINLRGRAGTILWRTLRQTLGQVGHRRLPGLSAEVAYNAMLSLFPAMLALFTAIGLSVPTRTTFERMALRLSELAPEPAFGLIRDFAIEVTRSQNRGLFSISFLTALWAASGAVSAVMNALDQIHQVPPSRKRPFWKAKLISLGLTLGTLMVLILASGLIFLGSVGIGSIVQSYPWLKPSFSALWQFVTLPVALGLVAGIFALLYRFGPSDRQLGTPLFPGAILAALIWAIVSNAFRFYVENFDSYNKVYGAIGAVIILLLWLDIMALALLVGGQLNVTLGENIRQH